jgi:hypothetical protein
VARRFVLGGATKHEAPKSRAAQASATLRLEALRESVVPGGTTGGDGGGFGGGKDEGDENDHGVETKLMGA